MTKPRPKKAGRAAPKFVDVETTSPLSFSCEPAAPVDTRKAERDDVIAYLAFLLTEEVERTAGRGSQECVRLRNLMRRIKSGAHIWRAEGLRICAAKGFLSKRDRRRMKAWVRTMVAPTKRRKGPR
jgi:hypothetical protein